MICILLFSYCFFCFFFSEYVFITYIIFKFVIYFTFKYRIYNISIFTRKTILSCTVIILISDIYSLFFYYSIEYKVTYSADHMQVPVVTFFFLYNLMKLCIVGNNEINTLSASIYFIFLPNRTLYKSSFITFYTLFILHIY
jgi:hypothetical protein